MLKNSLSTKPLVSIIMNCHNGEKYLDQSIKSILNQSYKNWEVIFFDNKSKDKSSTILKKYKDSRIKYHKSNKLYPLYKARNLAIKKSNGQLISFLDVDDWWAKSKLSKQVDIFLKNKNIDATYANAFLYYEKKRKKVIFIKNKINNNNITQKLIDKFEMPILTTLIKKEIFKKIQFNNKYTIIGDFDFFVRLSLIANIKGTQEPLAYYRIHDSNITTKKVYLHLRELEVWVKEIKKKKEFKSFNFKKLFNSINILKIKYNLTKGNKFQDLKKIFKISFSILKNKFF